MAVETGVKVNIIKAPYQPWLCVNNLVPTVSSMISATVSQWAAWQESSSISSEASGTPPEDRKSWEASHYSKNEHLSSEVPSDPISGSFALWAGLFSITDCTLIGIRK